MQALQDVFCLELIALLAFAKGSIRISQREKMMRRKQLHLNPQKSILVLLLSLMVSLAPGLALAQSWSPLNNPAPFSQAGNALLLTDGTVIVQQYSSASWFRLTPDNTGSYLNGTWSQIADLPPGYAPLYYASAVLPDGRVIVEGGEYNSLNQIWTNLGAIYDPKTNTWTSVAPPSGWQNIGDAQSVILSNGTFMLANALTAQQALLNSSNLTWTATGTGKADGNDEEGWTLLPSGKVLTVDATNQTNPTNSELYDPATGSWSSAGSTIVQLADPRSSELGPAVLRPDGTVFAAGGTSNTAIYNTLTGAWTQGPTFQNGLDVADGPAALLPSGNVLIDSSPGVFNPGSQFFEFDGTSLIPVPAPPNAAAISSFRGRMLVLPTGQILFAPEATAIAIYTPTGTYQSAWQPTITSVETSLTPGTSNHTISGTQFNGLSLGAAYGDDAQSATNYPLVRITNNGTGHVFYCKTHDHSTMGVATGAATVSTKFDVPSNIETGASTLQVVANGIPSAPASVTVVNPQNFQLTVTPASLTFSQGSSATATVVVASLNGFSSPTSLSISGLPSGVTGVFSPSTVTPPAGGSATSTLTLTASPTATSGIFQVNILGTSGSQSQMAQLTLNITVIQQPDFSISVSPSSVNAIQGGAGGGTTVTIGSINNFSSSTSFSISGVPTGVTATFSPSSVTPPAGGNASSTLTLSASAAAALGTFNLTITGTSSSPGITHNTTLTLTVSPPPPPDFSLSASPSSLAVSQGNSATSTVKVASINGFNSATNLAVSGAPTGVSVSLSPSSVTPPANSSASSTLSVSVSSSASTGSFTLTITGSSGTLTHTLNIGLTISSPPPPPPDFSLSLSPSSVTLMPSGSASTTVTVGSIGGFTDTVSLSATGLPSGVSASFSPTSVTPPSGGSASSSLTLTASSSAVAGTYTVTIHGIAGNSSHTVTLTLTIGSPADFTVSVAPQSLSIAQGSGASTTVTVGSLNGFNSSTSLSISGLPSGVTATFSPTSVTPPAGGSASSTLTLAVSSSASTGSFTVSIGGSSGSLSHSTNLTLTITGPPDFTVAASPSSLTVIQGSNNSTTVNVGSLNNFNGAVNLSISGLPSGVTATFSPVSVTPPAGGSASSTLTLAASATATTGSFTVSITGTSGSTSHSTAVTLTIAAKDFSVGASPSSVSVTSGGSSATSTVTITSLNGFNSATSLSISGLPSGVTASFSPTSVTPPAGGSASSTLTLTASSAAAAGTFTLTVTGSAGSLQHSTTVTLRVTAGNNPVPSISSISPSTAFSGGPGFTLTVNGSGFVSSSVINVQVGNTFGPRPTTFVSPTQLTVQITANDIANSGQIGISVTNPAPGGGTSNTVTLNVF